MTLNDLIFSENIKLPSILQEPDLTCAIFFSAIVSIEKQFQISSTVSGLMVSAGDFGYIPAVLFVSYFGGKVCQQ